MLIRWGRGKYSGRVWGVPLKTFCMVWGLLVKDFLGSLHLSTSPEMVKLDSASKNLSWQWEPPITGLLLFNVSKNRHMFRLSIPEE